MFVTLEDFFNNYRIKNQQQPNETVLNRGIMRLKRETRELKSVIDILTGTSLPTWNNGKIYEADEYVTYGELIYKSRIDQNFNNIPTPTDTVNWQLITIDSVAASKGTVIKHQVYTATEGQTVFVTPFNVDSTPMVFSDGLLLSEDRFTITNNTTITLSNACQVGEVITIIAGVTYDSSLVVAKQKFTSTANQYLFVTSFVLKNPSVFIDGLLIAESQYSWYNSTVELNTPIAAGKNVVIGNGAVLGSEIYTTHDVDTKLSLKRDISDSYSKTEVTGLLSPLASVNYVDTHLATLDSQKANHATTLSGYGITNAYTKTEVDTIAGTKLDATAYTAQDILFKLSGVDGAGSGLDADKLDGYDSWRYVRVDQTPVVLSDSHIVYASNKTEYLTDPTNNPLRIINEIYLDIDASQDYSGNPGIYIRKYDQNQQMTQNGVVYHSANTSHMMVVREGYFKGTWEPTLDANFGITNYADYNWVCIVTPTVTGMEHDYNKDFAAGHTPYTGFDNNVPWDENQSEYHYGYVQGNIVKMQAIHRNNNSIIDLPARYQLIGIVKTFSSYQWVNQS
jgi:hypothetical protein